MDICDLRKLLETDYAHFSNWLIAEEKGLLVGAVMRFEPEKSLEMLANAAENPLVELLRRIVFSDRSGVHLINLMGKEDAIASLIDYATKAAYKIRDNNVYVIEYQSKNLEALEKCSFKLPSEQDEGVDYVLLRRKYWRPLNRGKDKILGRICMEFDQFGDITIPEDLKVGDLIMMRECGAYDMTMSYLFGDAIERNIVTL